MQERETPIFINNPIDISSVIDQKLGNTETNASVFETYWLISQSVDDCGQGGLVQTIWLIDLCVREHQQPHDLVISSHAGHDQRGLLVICSLEVYIDFFVA